MIISRRLNNMHNRGRVPRPGSGGAAYSPLQEPGCVFLFRADDPGVATTSAFLTSPTDLSNAAWTKTGTAPPTLDGASGLYLLTSTATTANTTQNTSNLSTSQPCTYVCRLKRVASDWVCLQTNSSASGRTWVNLNTGAFGTIGVLHGTPSIVSLGSGVWQVTITSLSGPHFAFAHADADNSTLNTIGHSFLAAMHPTQSVDQVRCSGFVNLASGVTWTEAIANQQPLFIPNQYSGKPALRFAGNQRIGSTTDTGIFSAMAGASPAFTFVSMHNTTQLDAYQILLGIGDSTTGPTTGKVLFYYDAAGTDKYSYWRGNDAGTIVVWDALTAGGTTPHHLMVRSADGSTVLESLDGAAEVLELAAPPTAPLTLNQVIVGARPKLAPPDFFFVGNMGWTALYSQNLDAAALARLKNFSTTQWGTP